MVSNNQIHYSLQCESVVTELNCSTYRTFLFHLPFRFIFLTSSLRILAARIFDELAKLVGSSYLTRLSADSLIDSISNSFWMWFLVIRSVCKCKRLVVDAHSMQIKIEQLDRSRSAAFPANCQCPLGTCGVAVSLRYVRHFVNNQQAFLTPAAYSSA